MTPKSTLTKRLFTACFQVRCYSAVGGQLNTPYGDGSIPQAKRRYVPTSGTYPKGFLAGTSHAGVKASNTTKDDVTLIVSAQPCVAGAVFTRNLFQAAPVQASGQSLTARRNEGFRGVVVNSGCANAVTGKLGLEHAAVMARETDKCFGDFQTGAGDALDTPQTLVMSTGVIGQLLPIDKITAAIPKAHQVLGSDHEHWLKAAKAICTTDTFPKLLSRTFRLPSHPDTEYSIAGMTKGAGMIHPNMATLLGIICTDVMIDPGSIRKMLRQANAPSFNCISIDGDTSTNDTVALLANGAAAPSDAVPLRFPRFTHPAPDTQAFLDVLKEFMVDLAKLVVRDGEGATKFVTIRVQSEAGYHTAKRAAVSIARSALVKTALYGKDANWGRILCAIGYAPGIMYASELPALGQDQVVPEETSVSFIPADGSTELKLLERGEPQAVDEVRAKEILEMEDLEILVRLNDKPPSGGELLEKEGKEAVVWTCDFSHEYVTINGDYRT